MIPLRRKRWIVYTTSLGVDLILSLCTAHSNYDDLYGTRYNNYSNNNKNNNNNNNNKIFYSLKRKKELTSIGV